MMEGMGLTHERVSPISVQEPLHKQALKYTTFELLYFFLSEFINSSNIYSNIRDNFFHRYIYPTGFRMMIKVKYINRNL